MTIAAIDRAGSIWFKREFGDCLTALCACPISLEHLTWSKTLLAITLLLAEIFLIVHCDDLLMYFA